MIVKENQPPGWHSRGYLPHFDGGEILQFITLHLGDALPMAVLERWQMELAGEKNEDAQAIIVRRIEKYLDCGYGACYLRQEKIAAQAQDSLLHFDAIRYKLIAWVVMPNHAHFLIEPINNFSLSETMQKYKSFTAHQCNRLLKRRGQFWQEDYFDRYIRNYEHYEATVRYIENNPVKARLCKRPADWQFSSASAGPRTARPPAI